MTVKRVRAEEKVIKMKIISKIEKDIALNAIEKEYLSAWRVDSLVLPAAPLPLSFAELSASDIALLNTFKFSALNEFPDKHTNDLIFELATFFEQGIINNIEVHLKGAHVLKEWGIAPELVSKNATSSLNNYLIALSESEAWKEG